MERLQGRRPVRTQASGSSPASPHDSLTFPPVTESSTSSVTSLGNLFHVRWSVRGLKFP